MLESRTKPLLSKKRHLFKAVSYRVYSSCITFLISFIITGNCNIGLSIGVLDFTVKIFTYYIHERFWYRLDFGKIIQSKKEFDLDELRISIKQKIESCEKYAKDFKSSDMVTSELCSNAMKQAYNNILNEINLKNKTND